MSPRTCYIRADSGLCFCAHCAHRGAEDGHSTQSADADSADRIECRTNSTRIPHVENTFRPLVACGTSIPVGAIRVGHPRVPAGVYRENGTGRNTWQQESNPQ